MLGFLLDGHGLLVRVELDHAVTLRIVHVVAEHGRALTVLRLRLRLAQRGAQTVAVEDVVAQHERTRLTRDELLAQQERLRQTIRGRLHHIGEFHAILAAVAKQSLEVRQVLRRGDDKDVTDAGHHEHAQRIVDHRLVVHRKQLLRCHRRQRIQPRTRATGENDTFHKDLLSSQS